MGCRGDNHALNILLKYHRGELCPPKSDGLGCIFSLRSYLSSTWLYYIYIDLILYVTVNNLSVTSGRSS